MAPVVMNNSTVNLMKLATAFPRILFPVWVWVLIWSREICISYGGRSDTAVPTLQMLLWLDVVTDRCKGATKVQVFLVFSTPWERSP